METLSHDDILSLSNSIARVNSLRRLGNFHRTVLRVISKLISFDRAGYNNYDDNLKIIRIVHRTDEEQADTYALKDVLEANVHEHPFWNYNSGIKTLSEMMDHRKFRQTALYNEYYKNFGTESQILFDLPSHSRNSHIYAFSRGANDFNGKERLILELLRPHIITAYRNVCEMERFAKEISLLEKVADDNEKGIVLLSGNGSPRSLNDRARALMREYFGLFAADRHILHPGLMEWVIKEINSPEAVSERKPLKVQSPDPQKRAGGAYLSVSFNCSDPLLCDGDKSSTPAFMLLMKEKQPAVIESYGLTPREKEVLYWASMGKTNIDIAGIMGISRRTVEKHLENIYEKIGVETRGAAIAMANDER